MKRNVFLLSSIIVPSFLPATGQAEWPALWEVLMKARMIKASFVVAALLMLIGCGSTTAPTTASESSRVVSVTMGASPDQLGASETYTFTATVNNATDSTVTWAVSGCTAACGTISAAGVYTAPPFVESATSVTITATSRADTTKTASVKLGLRPVSVSLTPSTPSNVMLGATRSFTATLDHDPQNAGVTWTLSGAGCSGDGCGTLMNMTSTSVMYCAPAAAPSPHTVTLMATSVTDPTKKAAATVTVSNSAFLLEGKYAFLIHGWGTRLEAMAGQFSADGTGNFTGLWDANRGATADVGQAITGTYNIQPDGHGTMRIQAGSETFSYIVSMDSAGATGRFAESTVPVAGQHRGSSGYMVKQDENSFTFSALQGDRVVAVYGEATGSHVAALGQFAGTQAGIPGTGKIDLSWQINQNVAAFGNTVTLSPSFTAPDANTGRGTAAFGVANAVYNFAYYIVSQDRLLLVQTDARGFNGGLLIPMLSGEARLQGNAGSYSNASLNAPAIFYATDSTDDWMNMGYPLVRIGQVAPDGSGVTNMMFDQNVGGRDPEMIGFEHGNKITLNGTIAGPYSVSANGRAKWMFPPGIVFPTIDEMDIAYLIEENRGFLMTPDIDGAGFGVFEPQTGGPFSIGALAGKYVINTGPAATPEAENTTGWMTLDASGNGTATLYVNSGSGASPVNLTATATIASNGRGTLVLNATSPSVARNLVFWAISPDRWVAISTVDNGDRNPVLLFIERQEN
jgi:hypothetical protein